PADPQGQQHLEEPGHDLRLLRVEHARGVDAVRPRRVVAGLVAVALLVAVTLLVAGLLVARLVVAVGGLLVAGLLVAGLRVARIRLTRLVRRRGGLVRRLPGRLVRVRRLRHGITLWLRGGEPR